MQVSFSIRCFQRIRIYGQSQDAADFVRTIERRQGIIISAPEEIACRNGWIDEATLLGAAVRYGRSSYGAHLQTVAEGRIWYQ